MADKLYTEVQTRLVTGDSIEPKSYLLSPLDLSPALLQAGLCLPIFYNYQLDGEKLADALKKLLDKYPVLCGRLHPDKDTQFVIKVDPSDKERCFVPFYEIRSPLTLAEAVVKHGREVGAANGKDFAAFPFFCCNLDVPKKLEGKEPLLKMKLTHFADGCCLAATMCHGTGDGTTCGKMLYNLSEIYKGEEIGEIDHDRSYLWPDRLVESFPMLGEEMAKAPRKAAENLPEIPAMFLYQEPSQQHSLYIPKEDIEGLKARIKQMVGEEQIVSSNDIVTALFWMFSSEIASRKQPITDGKDLELDNTWTAIAAEPLANGYKCIPENYFGNIFALIPVIYTPDSSLPENEGPMSLIEALSKLTMAVRQTITVLRNTPAFYGGALASNYIVVSTGRMELPISFDLCRSAASNNVDLKALDADFGKGKPVLMMFTFIVATKNGSILQNGLNNKGAIIHFFLAETQKDFIKNSVILRDLTPGAKDIFDFTPTELAEKIGLKQ